MSTELTTASTGGALTVADVRQQVNHIQNVMREVMHKGEHFGTVPGCGDKPTLLKSGAEKLGFVFRLAPEFETTIVDMGNGHREYRVTCKLESIVSGGFVGSGVGSCSTLESKYRYRSASRKCPHCGKEAIIKGKEEYGGGWLCFKKKDGCGAKFQDGDPAIESQASGKAENPDIADVYNTVLKMAKKRAHVDAILTATAASDIFTQDVEDMPHQHTPAAAPSQRPANTVPDGELSQPEIDSANAMDYWVNKFAQCKTRDDLVEYKNAVVQANRNGQFVGGDYAAVEHAYSQAVERLRPARGKKSAPPPEPEPEPAVAVATSLLPPGGEEIPF